MVFFGVKVNVLDVEGTTSGCLLLDKDNDGEMIEDELGVSFNAFNFLSIKSSMSFSKFSESILFLEGFSFFFGVRCWWSLDRFSRVGLLGKLNVVDASDFFTVGSFNTDSVKSIEQ